MSNVVAFRRPDTLAPGQNAAHLLRAVVQDRRSGDDVYWLKEVAEMLGVFAATGQDLPQDALAPLALFYDDLENRMRFYPQYYRFLLSICLDMEDLGFAGAKGETLCHWAAAQGLTEAELSDLQRAEAGRLLARRGAQTTLDEGALAQRLQRFVAHTTTFGLPNKKVGYELTHIVFYLSDYGRRDPELAPEALRSLMYVGVLAFLDQDLDLLAEVCIALRYAGHVAPAIWAAAVAAGHEATQLLADATAPLNDGYHAYLVAGWAQSVAGRVGFGAAVPQGPLRVAFGNKLPGILRPMSETLFNIGAGRSADWSVARGSILACLGPEEHEVLYQAEQSVDCFDTFFEIFARSGPITPDNGAADYPVRRLESV